MKEQQRKLLNWGHLYSGECIFFLILRILIWKVPYLLIITYFVSVFGLVYDREVPKKNIYFKTRTFNPLFLSFKFNPRHKNAFVNAWIQDKNEL